MNIETTSPPPDLSSSQAQSKYAISWNDHGITNTNALSKATKGEGARDL